MRNILLWLINEEQGQGLTEYSLVIFLVAVGLVAAIAIVGQSIYDVLYIKVVGTIGYVANLAS